MDESACGSITAWHQVMVDCRYHSQVSVRCTSTGRHTLSKNAISSVVGLSPGNGKISRSLLTGSKRFTAAHPVNRPTIVSFWWWQDVAGWMKEASQRARLANKWMSQRAQAQSFYQWSERLRCSSGHSEGPAQEPEAPAEELEAPTGESDAPAG